MTQSSDFPFGIGNPIAPITGADPQLQFNGTEVGAVSETIAEVAGTLWFATNAQYSTLLASWVQVNPLASSFAMTRTSAGLTQFYSAAAVGAGVLPPITFTLQGTLSVVADAYMITAFSANGIFTTPADSTVNTLYRVRGIGGGGGGGGANGGFASGGGGGAGGYGEGVFSGAAALATIAITIGAGGLAGTAAPTGGGTGGQTIIAVPASFTFPGGIGGTSSSSGSSAAGAAGGLGGSAFAGALALQLTGATGLIGSGATATALIAGSGAPSAFGGGGVQNAGGGAGIAPGSGGSGGAGNGAVGNAGAPGLVIIERMTA